MGRGIVPSERHGERKGHWQRYGRERQQMVRERESELKDKKERKQKVKRE